MMVSRTSIADLSQHIAREFHPERIILFGSHAHGTPRHDSDVDLLVILDFEGTNMMKSLEILSRTQPAFAVDIIVRTPEEVQRRLDWNDFFMRDVIEQGQVLYESHHT